jgi:uncharacterized membrane protein YgdD (TMEM256/DUF423 family)
MKLKGSQAIALGAVFGFLAVAIGAFGAHKLEPYLEAIGRADTFETAARYQIYFSLYLLIIGFSFKDRSLSKLMAASVIFASIGIVIFSGSLYILCLTDTPRWGMVTPLGGLCFLASLALIFWDNIRNRSVA